MTDINGPGLGLGSGLGSGQGLGSKTTAASAWPAANLSKSPPRQPKDAIATTAAIAIGPSGPQQHHQSPSAWSSSSSATVVRPYVETSPSPLRPVRLAAHGAKNYEPYVEEEEEEEDVVGNEGEEEGDMLADSLGGATSHPSHHRHPQPPALVPLAPVLVRSSQMTHATHTTSHSFATAASAAATGDTPPPPHPPAPLNYYILPSVSTHPRTHPSTNRPSHPSIHPPTPSLTRLISYISGR